MATINSWSQGTESKLKSLFEKGLSTAEIGKRLGFTKNAIVGKINRLGLNNDPKKKPAQKKKAAPVKPAAKPVKKESEKKSDAKETKKKSVRITLQSEALMSMKSDQCRWPIGNPDTDNFRFCGEKCFSGKPYCFEHCKVAYQFNQSPSKKK